MRTPPTANIGRGFLTLMSSVYLGSPRRRRRRRAGRSGGINSTNRDDVLTDMLIGQMEAAFLAARAVRDQAADELDAPPSDPQAALALAILAKEVVTTNAIATVEKAVEIAEGRSYYRKSPLVRLTRDVRAAKFHPPASPVSFRMAGERARERASSPAFDIAGSC